MRVMHVLGTDSVVPYELVKLHEKQVLANHLQSVEKITRRGGLDWLELFCVLNDVPYNKNIMPEVAKYGVLNIVRDFNKSKNNKLDLRPCIVKLPNDPNNFEVDAHFHRWIEKREVIAPGGIVTYTVGIIEYGDGTIDECHPKNIKFTDRGRKI